MLDWLLIFGLALIGAVYLNGGSILIDTGSVAMHVDCCCDECECTVLETFGNCNCLDADFGSTQTAGDLQVTIGGSTTANTVSPCTSASNCPSLAGTYVVSCGSAATYIVDGYDCQSGSNHYFSTLCMEITYTNGAQAIVTIRSFQTVRASNITPYATPTNIAPSTCPSSGSERRQLVWNRTGTHDGYLYELTPPCDASCNTTVSRPKCASGSITPSDTTTTVTTPPCSLSGLTVALEIL